MRAYKLQIETDGSFEIEYKGVKLISGYPGIDGRQIKPLSIEIKKSDNSTEVVYQIKGGSLKQIYSELPQGLLLKTSLHGFDNAPHWILPICGMEIVTANRFFKQGFGFAGPSGMYNLDSGLNGKTLESYLTTGIIGENDETIVFGVFENKDFLHRTSLHSYYHRKGLNDQIPDGQKFLLDSGFSTEHINLPEKELRLPAMRFFFGDNTYETFVNYAKELAAANNITKLKEPRYHYCSWYHKGPYLSMRDVDELLEGLEKIEPKIPLQAIQIDDGYCPSAGDWLLPNHLFPGTMKEAFEKISAYGYAPGIWVAPFMVGSESEVAKNHRDWLLKDKNGSIHVEWTTHDGGSKNGAHYDEETYVLDSSHPEAFEYIRNIFKTMRKWGAVMYKTDFMDWGFRDSTEYKRFTPGKTSAQYFVDVIEMIREEIGQESYWLACISPFAQFVGLADGMRIGNDMVCSWSRGSAVHLLTETVADQYFNNILWQNDPDVTYVRDIASKFSETETKAVALWNAMSGGSMNTSDPLHRVSPDALKLWRFLQPSDNQNIRTVYPNWEKTGLKNMAVRKIAGLDAYAVYVINIEDTPFNEVINVKLATGLETAHVYEWEPGSSRYLGEKSEFTAKLQAHGGQLFYVSKEKEDPVSGRI